MPSSLRLPESLQLLIDTLIPTEAVSANLKRLAKTGVKNIYPECREKDPNQATICHHERIFGQEVSDWELSCAFFILLKMILIDRLPNEVSLDPKVDLQEADLDQFLTGLILQQCQEEKRIIQIPSHTTIAALLAEEFMIYPERLLMSSTFQPRPPESVYPYHLTVLQHYQTDLVPIVIIDTSRSHLPVTQKEKIAISNLDHSLNFWHLEILHYLRELNISPEDGCVTITFTANRLKKSDTTPETDTTPKIDISRKNRKAMKFASISIGIVGSQENFLLNRGTQKAVNTHRIVVSWLRANAENKFAFNLATRNMLASIRLPDNHNGSEGVIKAYGEARKQMEAILTSNGYYPTQGFLNLTQNVL